MTDLEMLSYVDHTQLKAFATWEDIEELCKEAVEYKTATVCIPPPAISAAYTRNSLLLQSVP